MKKIKFLNGISAVFAIAAVALATTFTSCEKENFEVEVKPVTPINAEVQIKPIVLFVDDNVTTDVTSKATITGAGTTTGNPELAANPAVTITATYEGITASVTVSYPELKAGQILVLTPTIVLQRTTKTDIVIPEDGIKNPRTETKEGEIPNITNFWYTATATYTEKTGNKIVKKEIIADDLTSLEKVTVNNFFNGLSDTYVEAQKEIPVTVYAASQTEVKVTYAITETTYEIYRKNSVVTKAEVSEALVAVAVVDSYSTQIDVKEYQQIPGYDAPKPGHQHGHGHGNNPNAGGGIIIAD